MFNHIPRVDLANASCDNVMGTRFIHTAKCTGKYDKSAFNRNFYDI